MPVYYFISYRGFINMLEIEDDTKKVPYWGVVEVFFDGYVVNLV